MSLLLKKIAFSIVAQAPLACVFMRIFALSGPLLTHRTVRTAPSAAPRQDEPAPEYTTELLISSKKETDEMMLPVNGFEVGAASEVNATVPRLTSSCWKLMLELAENRDRSVSSDENV